MADRFQPIFERLENLLLVEIDELLAKAFQIAEGVFVDKTDKTKQLKQRILQRSRCEQQFALLGQRQLQRVGYDVCWLVDVTQPMGFVDDHQIPWRSVNVRRLATRELVRADNDRVFGFKGLEVALF